MLSQYKWIIYAAIVAVYTLSVWHISTTYAESSYVKRDLAVAHSTLDTLVENQQKVGEASSKLQAYLEAMRIENRNFNKELYEEILTDPRYKSCLLSDRVRDAIKAKLANQPD